MSTQHSQPSVTKITLETLRAGLDHLTPEELQLLKQEVEQRLEDTADWLDTEYVAYARKYGDASISLESLREELARIKGNMSDVIIEEREDRF